MQVKEYRAELKSLDDEKGTGTIVFATLDVIDKDGDITDRGAFGEQKAHLLPMHIWRDADPPFLGVANIREDGSKALADIEVNLDTQRGRDWFSAMKFALDRGKIIEWSYGFDVIDSDSRQIEGKTVRGLKKLKVHEVSPVVIGAGEETEILSLKERKLATPLEGSWEETLDRLHRAAADLLMTDEEDQWVSIQATFSDRVIVALYDWAEDTRYFEFSWSVSGDAVALADQTEVEFSVVVRAKSSPMAVEAARIMGGLAGLLDRIKALTALRTEQGRKSTISRTNVERLTHLKRIVDGMLATAGKTAVVDTAPAEPATDPDQPPADTPPAAMTAEDGYLISRLFAQSQVTRARLDGNLPKE